MKSIMKFTKLSCIFLPFFFSGGGIGWGWEPVERTH